MQTLRIKFGQLLLTFIVALFLLNLGFYATSMAATIQQSGNQIVTATVPGPPPTSQAIILSPQNNQTVTTTPLVVSGTCGGTNTIVKVFLNGNLAGTTNCLGDGTFSLNIILGFGRNDLSAFVYDSLDQVGPNSDIVTIYVTPLTSSSTEPNTPSSGGTISTPGQNTEPGSIPPSDETYQAEQGLFSRSPFKSIADILGINSTSATSPLAVKTATVAAGAGAVVLAVATVQFMIVSLINLDPTRSWAYRFLVKIILK